MRLRNQLVGALLALGAILVVAGGTAQAQVLRPFKVVGTGVAPTGLPLPGQPARPHWIVGTATHLGKHTGLGSVKTDSAVPNLMTGVISGTFGSGDPFVFVAADGSRLGFYYGRVDKGAKQPGVFTLTPVSPPNVYVANFVAEFVVAPETCTGRFVGTRGSFIMYAVTAPFALGGTDPLPYSWQGQGKLLFPR